MLAFTVDVSESVAKAAGVLAESHALRGTDAIHIASAVTLTKQAGESAMFLCFAGRSPLHGEGRPQRCEIGRRYYALNRLHKGISVAGHFISGEDDS